MFRELGLGPGGAERHLRRAAVKSPIPLFLISFNRGEALRATIDGARRLEADLAIVVRDNGSDDAATLAVLRDLETSGVTVVRRGPISHADELNRVDDDVANYFRDRPPSRYLVSDCDIDLSVADPGALSVYDELLDRFPGVESVGPMLRISDVPRSYPLFNRVMNRHVRRFWRHRPSIAATSAGPVAFLRTVIDTTFALHRAGAPFRRMKKALRVYNPYDARHMEWYAAADEAGAYYSSSSPNVAHWNNAEQRKLWRDEPLRYSSYFDVRKTPSGRLVSFRERL